MPAIPDTPAVFYMCIEVYANDAAGGRMRGNYGLMITESVLDGATLRQAVDQVDEGHLHAVLCVRPQEGTVVDASAEVANDWLVRNLGKWPLEKDLPDFVQNHGEKSMVYSRRKPEGKYYSSAEDPPH